MDPTILLAVDGSAADERALAWLESARPGVRGLRVVVVNVQPPPLVAWPAPGLDRRAVEAALLERGQGIAGPIAARLQAAGCAVRQAVRLGSPAEALMREAEEVGASLVAVGTRGHGLLHGFALGSVALRVAHASPVPVLLVPPLARPLPTPDAACRVLLAVDGSEESERAADAVRIARAWLGEVEVRIAHVQEPLTLVEAVLPSHADLVRQWSRSAGEAAVAQARRSLDAAGIPAVLDLAAGDPAATILRLAQESECQLIALGSRGLGAAHHAFVGSVALKVAAHAAVPTLIAKVNR
jgi:nucleotide-binding universal stress UspA family protein